MRALCGEVNDSCYLSFNVDLQGEVTDDHTGLWTIPKQLVRGSQAFQKGTFRSTPNDAKIDKATLTYRDVVNTIEVFFSESKLAPLSKIRIGLPKPDKYEVSEFFVKGHLQIDRINLVTRQKTIQGEPVMKLLRDGKKINIIDKLSIEKLGESILRIEEFVTELGTIQQIKNRSNLEI